MIVFAIIGMALVLWVLAGALIALFFVRFTVKEPCPLHVKVLAIVPIFMALPWITIINGKPPPLCMLTDE